MWLYLKNLKPVDLWMKYDAMKHQGKKGINTAEEIGKDFGDSGRQVQRYIKLTELIPELLDEIDNAPDKRLIIGVSLASLSKEEQEILYRFLDDENKFPSMKQAALISEASKNNLFSLEALVEIFSEGKEKHQSYKISLEKNFLQKFFGDKSKAEIEAELQNIITDYFFKRSVD